MNKVEMILDELRNRSGFDDIFGNLDGEILKEIEDAIYDIIFE